MTGPHRHPRGIWMLCPDSNSQILDQEMVMHHWLGRHHQGQGLRRHLRGPWMLLVQPLQGNTRRMLRSGAVVDQVVVDLVHENMALWVH